MNHHALSQVFGSLMDQSITHQFFYLFISLIINWKSTFSIMFLFLSFLSPLVFCVGVFQKTKLRTSPIPRPTPCYMNLGTHTSSLISSFLIDFLTWMGCGWGVCGCTRGLVGFLLLPCSPREPFVYYMYTVGCFWVFLWW